LNEQKIFSSKCFKLKIHFQSLKVIVSETMSDELILRSKKPSIEIPLKSFGEIIWEKIQELNEESVCIVSKK
jgi:hypothetical protein